MLTVTISSQKTESEESFLERVLPHLSPLRDLKGSFDRTPGNMRVHHHLALIDGDERWSLTAAVGISVGRDRGKYLCRLYQAILRLIELSLPLDTVKGEPDILRFS